MRSCSCSFNYLLMFYDKLVSEPLDILEGWTMELFSKVKAGPLLDMTPKTDMPFWKSGKLYKLEAVRDVHSLYLSWTLPCLHKEYMKKPEDYLAHLLGHGKCFQHIHCLHCSSMRLI